MSLPLEALFGEDATSHSALWADSLAVFMQGLTMVPAAVMHLCGCTSAVAWRMALLVLSLLSTRPPSTTAISSSFMATFSSGEELTSGETRHPVDCSLRVGLKPTVYEMLRS